MSYHDSIINIVAALAFHSAFLNCVQCIQAWKITCIRENDLYIRNIGALKISNTSASIKDSSGFCVIEFNSALQGI